MAAEGSRVVRAGAHPRYLLAGTRSASSSCTPLRHQPFRAASQGRRKSPARSGSKVLIPNEPRCTLSRSASVATSVGARLPFFGVMHYADQDRRPGRQGQLNVGHRQGHVPVTTCRPDLYLPHPRQARREGPRGDRPGGAAPGRLALAGRRCRRGKVSSHDHYSQPGPAGSLDMCRAPGTGQAAGRDMHRMTQPGLLWASVWRRGITSATLPGDAT
jgi:hypothetical protein